MTLDRPHREEPDTGASRRLSIARWLRPAGLAGLLAAAVLASGCATLNTVPAEVTRYAQWPADRKPGSYAFERLPSQQAQPGEQAPLEEAAARALEMAGFTRAEDASRAEYRIQVGARLLRSSGSPWVDDRPGGPWGPWGPWGRPYARYGWYGPGASLGLGWSWDTARYEREVGVLIRDGRNGTPLYEARAGSPGSPNFSAPLLAALFEAAMKDFPAAPGGPQRVLVEWPK